MIDCGKIINKTFDDIDNFLRNILTEQIIHG